METRDLKNIRPFNLEEAIAGKEVINHKGYAVKFLCFCDELHRDYQVTVFIKDSSNCPLSYSREGKSYHGAQTLFMKPDLVIEDTAIYLGDTLFVKDVFPGRNIKGYTILKVSETAVQARCLETQLNFAISIYKLTLTKPKTAKKGFVNIYPDNSCSNIYSTKADADEYAFKDRVDCIEINWEE